MPLSRGFLHASALEYNFYFKIGPNRKNGTQSTYTSLHFQCISTLYPDRYMIESRIQHCKVQGVRKAARKSVTMKTWEEQTTKVTNYYCHVFP